MAAAGSLQNNANDVARNKNPRVQLRTQTTELRRNSKTNLRQRSINSSRVEGWSESEQDDVHFEAEIGEGVVVEEQFGDVA